MSYYLERIQRGVDFIETHLDEDISLGSVAKAAGISQWHFQRIFKALTGETLKTYIRARRLAGSLDRLLTTKLRVLDIALLAGFDSQESFARAFKKAFGMTPQEYRSIGDRSLFLRKVELDTEYLRHINENVSLTPEIVTRAARTMVGARTHFFGVDSEKNNVGDQLPPLWQMFLPRLAEVEDRVPGFTYGIVRQDPADPERLEYHAAVEVSGPQMVPDGMVSLELPETTYAMFSHRGAVKHVDHTVNYIYSTWLAQSGRRHSYGADLEIYGSEYHPTSEDSVMYYAIPID